MSVRGIVLVGLVGIALLLAVAFVGIQLLGSREPPPAPPRPGATGSAPAVPEPPDRSRVQLLRQ
jgi:hypothetical protein